MEMFRYLGNALMSLRELRGLSQAELARQAGIGKSQLSKYERGKELPKLDSLERILKALRVSQLGLFYTLHLIETQAKVLAAGEAIQLDLVSVPELGLVPEKSAQAFRKVIADVMEMYERLLQDVLFRRNPPS